MKVSAMTSCDSFLSKYEWSSSIFQEEMKCIRSSSKFKKKVKCHWSSSILSKNTVCNSSSSNCPQNNESQVLIVHVILLARSFYALRFLVKAQDDDYDALPLSLCFFFPLPATLCITRPCHTPLHTFPLPATLSINLSGVNSWHDMTESGRAGWRRR